MNRRDLLLSLLSLPWLSLFGFSARGRERTLDRVAFGSCAIQTDPQPIWLEIAKTNPDLFIFGGDNIYADTYNPEDFAIAYAALAAIPEFRQFRARVPIVATWDDHDFGVDAAGADYPLKDESKDAFLEFFNEPADSRRRGRPGVYDAYMFGEGERSVQVILLDLRWFRSDSEMVGEEQWLWLESELRRPAAARLLMSSIQFASSDHIWDKWSDYPRDKARFLSLLDRLNVRNLVVLSGDMHFAELSLERTPGGIELYDLTASGLNRYEPLADLPNRRRLAVYDQSEHFGLVEIHWDSKPLEISLQIRDNAGQSVISHRFSLT